MNPTSIDFNCDLGESFGVFRIGNDEQILPYITSANIACGFHSGDPAVMKRTVQLALEKGVAIGAHPGLPDLAGFGRRKMAVSPEEGFDLVVYQVGALLGFVQAAGGVLHHVKPHGTLYNMAAENGNLARAIAEAVYRLNPELVLYGLAGSELIRAGEELGLRTAQEVFADRTYQENGSLTSRNLPDARITDPEMAVQQVVRMLKEGKVISQQGTAVSVQADTICIHGDGPDAPAFARKIYERLQREGIQVKAV